MSPRQLSGRGVWYWTDGKGDERVIYFTTGYRMVELDARTGSLIPTFANGGVLDLKVGVVKGVNQQIDLETGEIGIHSTPTVVGDIVIVGSSFREGATVSTHNNTKGLVRAFDVRTGKQLWRFNTIPGPGEYGSETWENDAWAVNGNVGVWTQITVDEELGLVYLPVETPTSDHYGGHRPGNNLFADSLVCVDVKTGKRKWHFQFVHHSLWNFDMSSAPLLADITVDGKAIKAVAVPSKQNLLYVFDRVSGRPVWPIEERPVPKGDVPGETYSPTQPYPTKPPVYARNFVNIPDDIIDFTPEMRAQALKQLERYKPGPLFNPPILGNVNGLLGALTIGNLGGGTNWPGGAYDPELHIVFAPASNAGVAAFSLVPPPAGFSDIRYVRGVAGQPFVEVFGPGDCCAADSPRAIAQAAARGTARARSASRRGDGSTRGWRRRRWRRAHRAGASDRQAAVRRALSAQPRPRRADVERAARRHARRRSKSSRAEGLEHSQDGPAGQRRIARHQDARHHGRSAGHHHRARTRGHAARLRQGDRRRSGRGVDARTSKRIADDLQHRRPTVHRRRSERRKLLGRIHRVQTPELSDCEATERRTLNLER